MRAIYAFLSALAGLLALGRGPGAFVRNRARQAAIRGVTRNMRKWGL